MPVRPAWTTTWRARVAASLAAGGMMTACSLLSTDGLTGNSGDAAPFDGAIATNDASDASTDLGLDTATALDAADADAADAAKDPSLIAAYSFEDPNGAVVVDTTGNGKNGALVAGASFAPGGIRGRAIALHGADYFEVTALNGAQFPLTGTFSVWCRYTSPADELVDRNVLDGYNSSRNHLFLRHSNGGTTGTLQAALQLGDGSGGYAFVKEIPAAQNAWVHVVMTWDEKASVAAVYAGGVLVLQKAYDTSPYAPTAQVFRLGNTWIGFIDEVKLYNRALTPDQATALD